jgi:hypothetical protein
MGLPLLIFAVVAMVLIGVGIAVGLVGCVLAAGLLGLGIVSSSFIIGLRSGRPAAGVRAFLVQCGIVAGVPAGAACAWLGKTFFQEFHGDLLVILYGGLGGALAGIIVALALDYISRRLHAWASARLLPARAEVPAIAHREAM